MNSDEEVKKRAEEYARQNKKVIARQIADINVYPPDEFPVSVFMAGSPGAGKTESSRNLIEKLSKNSHSILRIDPDDFRSMFTEYTGRNSSLFVYATSIIADKIHDLVLENNQNFIFDGTMSNLERSRENIKRSLGKKRSVQIVYVYQEPIQAWNFVKARESKDGRNIPKDAFIEQYFLARGNVNTLKREFGEAIQVDLIVKNIDGTNLNYIENIDVVDSHVVEKYTRDELRKIIDKSHA